MARLSTESDPVLRGRRLTLRALRVEDYPAWSEVRTRCREWLLKWEPRPARAPYPMEDRPTFAARCAMRDRERALGSGFAFGVFLGETFLGEANLSGIQRGAMQSGSVGYWIDETAAGNSYVPEACALIFQYAFEQLKLHRIQISIVPRNGASRAVARKLWLRGEGIAQRYLEIDGVWEDHVWYAITEEEWRERSARYLREWITPDPESPRP